ncbi:MAG TPA: hypothetical protein DDZ80_00710 [Cyanobacteria bacterium UBA8803]|nr:hypothetical protein [Cyanobacteria bacterium UBA9273]HBL57131.1 hypothetical protein [Cyanobacteria bacterium UBA8803]
MTHLINRYKVREGKTLNYKDWILLKKKQLHGIAFDYADPSGHILPEPFCFYTLNKALSYGKTGIKPTIQSRVLLNRSKESVTGTAID